MKTCSKCNRSLEPAAFYVDATKKSGLSSRCRECVKESAGCWYRDNTARARASAKRWQAENPERYYARKLAWQKANPEKRAESEGRRRTRLRGGFVEPVDPFAVAERDGWRCHICGDTVARRDMSLDHLVPIARGGTHEMTNVRLAHLSCNVKRGAGRIPAQLILL